MAALRLLAAAAASGRTAYVYFIGDRLKHWGTSDKAAKSPENASTEMQHLIDTLKPDVVVTEDTRAASRKSTKTKKVIAAMAESAERAPLLDVWVKRTQTHANKYDEAEALARIYPELQAWVPKRRRFFDNEPRNTVLFEALALADYILQRPTENLAGAME